MSSVSDQPEGGVRGLNKKVSAGSVEARADALKQWFARCWPEREVVRLDRFDAPAEGLASELWMFDVTWRESGSETTERFVLRLAQSGMPLAPRLSERFASALETEFRVQQAVTANTSCPLAPLVGIDERGEVLGRPFYVMQHLPGRAPPAKGPNVDSFVVHEATPDDRRALVENGLAAMVAAHRLNYVHAGLQWLDPGAGSPFSMRPALLRYRDAYERELQGAKHRELEEGMAWLLAHEPADLEPALVWGDARPGNILYDPHYEVVAVLDWEMTAIMTRETDVAHWLFMDHMVHEAEGVARLPGYPTREEQLAFYEQRFGAPVRNLAYWELFAAVKLMYGFLWLVRRMQAAGQIARDDDALIHDNFAVRFARLMIGRRESGLVNF